jgi:phosphohistidine phosphatase
MRRRLIVMRHAKSAWNTEAPDDHSRPLNKRGRRDAPRVAEELAELGWLPELVVSSDSQRTRDTWQGMQPSLGDAVQVRFVRTLYHAGIDAVRLELADVDDAVATVMVLGHNPGWEEVVEELSGEDHTMTTANAALLSVDAPSWREAVLLDSCWSLHQILRPRELD